MLAKFSPSVSLNIYIFPSRTYLNIRKVITSHFIFISPMSILFPVDSAIRNFSGYPMITQKLTPFTTLVLTAGKKFYDERLRSNIYYTFYLI